MSVCRRCIVSGRVQGVFYRDTTRRKATALGVTGSARNLPDGSVEVIACGEPQAVEALCRWLWQGPDHARVDEVRCAEMAYEMHAGFVVS